MMQPAIFVSRTPKVGKTTPKKEGKTKAENNNDYRCCSITIRYSTIKLMYASTM